MSKKGIDEIYWEVQQKWLKDLIKRECHGGDAVVFGEDEHSVYLGKSYFLVRIPKRFFLFNTEQLQRNYPTGFRSYDSASKLFADTAEQATLFAKDSLIRREQNGRKYVVLDCDGVKYNVDEKFMALVKDFPTDCYKVSGKENTAVVLGMYGENFALVLPCKMKD